jgi:hypothetical protein
MPTIYATKTDIEDELQALFPSGFTESTDPTEDEVTAKIAEVTTGLRVRVIRALGEEPEAGNDAAVLVKRGVVAQVVAWILRKVSVGYGAADVEKLVKPYTDTYADVKKEIEMLPDLYRKETVVTTHVGRTGADYRREPIMDDGVIGRTDTF